MCRIVTALREIDPSQVGRWGGKAANLALLTRAGLPVPNGFCIASDAYFSALAEGTLTPSPELAARIQEAYIAVGGGPVAVRSSAVAEDSEAASFAGQGDTILAVSGAEAVVDAVARCWRSARSARASAYRSARGIDEGAAAMAVIVQKMIPSDASGVMFTRDPNDPNGNALLIEGSWGLGEGIVSGRIQPDRFRIERPELAITARDIAEKLEMATPNGFAPVPEARRLIPCVTDEQIRSLAEAGIQIENLYGAPQDVEWALADGRLWILQARPITASAYSRRREVRWQEIEALRARAEPEGTVWSRYSVAEVLPEPLPMSWAVARHLMSGRGGCGLMYRDLGFDPDPSLDDDGVLDLICGRPYFNLSRERRVYFRWFPYDYPFAELKANPEAAVYPTPTVNLARAPRGFWLRLPITVWTMWQADRRVRRLRETLHRQLREQVFPAFARQAEEARNLDLGSMHPAELVALFQEWHRRTLEDFARDALKPSVLAGLALSSLENALKRIHGEDAGARLARELVSGVSPDPEADVGSGLLRLAAGELTTAEFLEQFGHRGPNEMELASPRWRERPPELIGQPGRAVPEPPPGVPLPPDAKQELDFARTYLSLRETAKHYLMMGFEVMRLILLELDRRFRLNGGIFFLEPDELTHLIAGERFEHVIAERRERRQIALSLNVPRVLFSDDLDAIGRPVGAEEDTSFQGTSVSPGVAEGPALVLRSPSEAPPDVVPGFILVCPSTDPGWTPLFLKAAGLVMETGGMLSHGAIVARELGLPAVVNIPEATRRLQSGWQIRVDGDVGAVVVVGARVGPHVRGGVRANDGHIRPT